MKRYNLTYPKIIALGFLLLIATGTVLLMLPIASRDGQSVGFINALFTTTSATCVTGLVVFDTYAHWTVFGQLVIICLIQIGGLGFMTIITMFSFFLRRKIGLTERSLLRESINTMYIGGIIRLTKKILYGTLIFEGVGALLFSIRLIPKMGWATGIYNSVFLAISAFCNAGFDLMGRYQEYSSLTLFSGDAIISLTTCALITIGGLGFFVWDDLYEHKFHFSKYRLHTKIVLTVTSILIVFGTAAFLILEYNNTLAGMPFYEKVLAALFDAVTPRTAGFNSTDVASLTPASKLLMMIYMFIGGSPGSTAGGVKTTTIIVLFVTVWANLRNKNGMNIYRRRLENDALSRATTVVCINLCLLTSVAFIISALQPSLGLVNIFFEVFSAIGTVGITTGITRDLNVISKLLIIFLMYIGRVGSLSFATLFTQRKLKEKVQMPEEKINIG